MTSEGYIFIGRDGDLPTPAPQPRPTLASPSADSLAASEDTAWGSTASSKRLPALSESAYITRKRKYDSTSMHMDETMYVDYRYDRAVDDDGCGSQVEYDTNTSETNVKHDRKETQHGPKNSDPNGTYVYTYPNTYRNGKVENCAGCRLARLERQISDSKVSLMRAELQQAFAELSRRGVHASTPPALPKAANIDVDMMVNRVPDRNPACTESAVSTGIAPASVSQGGTVRSATGISRVAGPMFAGCTPGRLQPGGSMSSLRRRQLLDSPIGGVAGPYRRLDHPGCNKDDSDGIGLLAYILANVLIAVSIVVLAYFVIQPCIQILEDGLS
ncbi:hypothetical protein DRE_01507 [Drechslerella stenobrocha 248]|uniref:Transmembrane protein n=1 Tax=Drechslerella stenobrocha 248 TaxID=1043628 RepID=W7I4G7_9PEZI|nr:hypothetical protein DRE_01507 [Drechslerella stenobrocha 248]